MKTLCKTHILMLGAALCTNVIIKADNKVDIASKPVLVNALQHEKEINAQYAQALHRIARAVEVCDALKNNNVYHALRYGSTGAVLCEQFLQSLKEIDEVPISHENLINKANETYYAARLAEAEHIAYEKMKDCSHNSVASDLKKVSLAGRDDGRRKRSELINRLWEAQGACSKLSEREEEAKKAGFEHLVKAEHKEYLERKIEINEDCEWVSRS